MNSFFALIDHMNHHPEQQETLEPLLWETFGVQRAVLALDMSGFSLSVRRDGIIAYLRKIRRMQEQALPCVRQAGGEVVKCDADNLMAVFADAAAAVQAALAMRNACGAVGIQVSIGIDFGHILLIPDTDCWGDAVNLAYKLGEDLARAGEILITDTVRDRLAPETFTVVGERLSVAGLELKVWRVE